MFRQLLIGGLFLLSLPTFSQIPGSDQMDADPDELVDPQRPSWVVKSNPLRVLWGAIPFTAEYRLNLETPRSRYQSTEVGISYMGESPILKSMVDSINGRISGNYGTIDIQVRGARLQFAHKFYLKGIFPGLDQALIISSYAPNGYYISPNASIGYAEFTLNNASLPFLEMTHMNVNLLFGRQMFFWNSIALDVFIGGGLKKNIWKERDPANHNVRVVNPDRMLFYGGNFRFSLGFHVGIPF